MPYVKQNNWSKQRCNVSNFEYLFFSRIGVQEIDCRFQGLEMPIWRIVNAIARGHFLRNHFLSDWLWLFFLHLKVLEALTDVNCMLQKAVTAAEKNR